MVEARTAVRGTAWAIYAFLVGEILFLISPLAPLFYWFYGPLCVPGAACRDRLADPAPGASTALVEALCGFGTA